MPLESATWATQLDTSYPQSSDPRSEGDDHLRLIKSVMQTELSAANRQWIYTGLSATRVSSTAITVDGDRTSTFPDGRRVKITGDSTGTFYGEVSSSTYSANTRLSFDAIIGSLANETLHTYVSAVEPSVHGLPLAARTYYVSTSGSDSAAGTSAAPFATIQKAVDVIQSDPSILSATIELAAGTYNEAVTFSSGFTALVDINGPTKGHPNVPTAIVDGTGITTSKAFSINEGNFVRITDVKVTGFSGGQAFNNNRGRLTLTNCHTDNCSRGIISQHGALTTVSGGDYDGNSIADSIGWNSLYNSTHVHQPSDLTGAALFHDWATGLQMQEGCQGHLDYIKIHDCTTVGLASRRGTGAMNLKEAQIYRNAIGISVDGPWFNNNVDFGSGANANTVNVRDSNAPEWDFRTNDFVSRTKRVQTQTTVSLTHTGDTNATLLWTPFAGRDWMVSEAGHVIAIHMGGNFSALSGTATLALRSWDGSTEDALTSVVVPASSTEFALDAHIMFTAATAQRCVMNLNTDQGQDRGYGVGAHDYTNSSFQIRLYVTLSNSGDTFELDMGYVETTLGG